MAVHKTAVPVVGVFTQAHIGDDDQFRDLVLHRLYSALDDAVFGVSLGPQGILSVRDAEENDAGNAQVKCLPGHLDQVVN